MPAAGVEAAEQRAVAPGDELVVDMGKGEGGRAGPDCAGERFGRADRVRARALEHQQLADARVDFQRVPQCRFAGPANRQRLREPFDRPVAAKPDLDPGVRHDLGEQAPFARGFAQGARDCGWMTIPDAIDQTTVRAAECERVRDSGTAVGYERAVSLFAPGGGRCRGDRAIQCLRLVAQQPSRRIDLPPQRPLNSLRLAHDLHRCSSVGLFESVDVAACEPQPFSREPDAALDDGLSSLQR